MLRLDASGMSVLHAQLFGYLSARHVLFTKCRSWSFHENRLRLSLCYRALQRLKANYVSTVSSAALSKPLESSRRSSAKILPISDNSGRAVSDIVSAR